MQSRDDTDKYSILCVEVSKKREIKDERLLLATGRAASYAMKSGFRILNFLLNHREVLDVGRNGAGGEDRCGKTRGRSLNQKGNVWRAASLI